MKRKRYRELYELRDAVDPLTGKERKEALYRGEWYRLSVEPGQKRKMETAFLLFLLSSLLLFLACGLLDTPGSRSFYVLPFYLFMAFPLFYACMAAFRFSRLSSPFTEVQKECLDSLLHSCAGLMLLSVLYALGDILFLALGGAGDGLLRECLGLACVAGIGVPAAFARRAASGIEAVPCPKEDSIPS